MTAMKKRVGWNFVEDTAELSEETKRELAESRKQAKEGKVKSLEQIKKEVLNESEKFKS